MTMPTDTKTKDIDPYIHRYKELNYYVAHSLTYDLVAVGDTQEKADSRLDLLIEAQLRSGNERDWNPIFPAPYQFWLDYWS